MAGPLVKQHLLKSHPPRNEINFLNDAFSLISYKHLIIFRVLGYASNSANFEITQINYSSKDLGGGCDDLKCVYSGGKGYLENAQKRRRERSV